MLNKDDLREYRLMSGLTYRDVARYCDVTFQLIEEVEKGKTGVTQYNHDQIVMGINNAKMAKANGTFDEDKKKDANGTKRKAPADKSPGKPK